MIYLTLDGDFFCSSDPADRKYGSQYVYEFMDWVVIVRRTYTLMMVIE